MLTRPPAAAAPKPVSGEDSAARAGSMVRLEPLAPSPERATLPRVEISEPRFGDVLPAVAARAHSVQVRVSTVSDGDRVLLSLDGRRPRVLPASGALRLGELLPEDEAVTNGAHSLLAVVVTPEGLPLRAKPPGRGGFALLDFFVGDRTGAVLPAPLPRLFCLGPTGTFHGSEAERLLLALFVVGAAPASMPFRILAPGVDHGGSLAPAQPYAVSGLPSGDVRLLVGALPGPRAECVATLNRDPSRANAP